jgi:hypothetical protein
MKTNSLIRLAASIGVASTFAYACGSDTGVDSSELPNRGGTGGTSGAGKAGSTASGGTGSGTPVPGSGGTAGRGGGIIEVPDASTADPDASVSEDAACGRGSADASLLPVNMFVMFDRSTSMVNMPDPVSMKDRWTTATEALSAFFQDAGADGLGVALRFFPHDTPAAGCTGLNNACDAVACSMPLVDMGVLSAEPAPNDMQEQLLLDAITASAPMTGGGGIPMPGAGGMGAGGMGTAGTFGAGGRMGGGIGMQFPGTPIYPALDGSLRWATEYQAAHPEQKTIVLFVTDGDPSVCEQDFDEIAALASDALTAAGINTYAIGLADSAGMGVNPNNMNALAEAGGTQQAFFINDGPTASQDLLETLNAIRGMALSCDFPMPEATEQGEEIDSSLVNVTFTAGDGTETTFTKVVDAAGCDTAKSWYYDNEAAPTRIYLCPAACEAVTSDPEAHFGILVGCKPQIEPPH